MAVKTFIPKSTGHFHSQLHHDRVPTRSLLPVADDLTSCLEPIDAFEAEHIARVLPESVLGADPQELPAKPNGFGEHEWLQPSLTRNEYLRLTAFWYHARDALDNEQLVASIKSKVDLVREFLDWDSALCGLLDMDTFVRGITDGIATALVPRRESTCSHTLQMEGDIFQSPDLSKDWRFKASPAVVNGGLKSYAGAPIKCQLDNGETVSLGSLCVISSSPGKVLSPSQQATLIRFANLVMTDILAQSRARRKAQQQQMHMLLNSVTALTEPDEIERRTMAILHDIYPEASTSLVELHNNAVFIAKDQTILISDCIDGIWEDTALINRIITKENQHTPSLGSPLRALIGCLRLGLHSKVLVVTSSDLRLVFDEIDSWFVHQCASILSNVAQERSLRDAKLVKERFLRGVTHQLRTPIHGILGSVDLLVEDLSARKLLRSQPLADDDLDEDFTQLSISNPETTAPNGAAGLDTAEILRTIKNSGRELMSTVNNILRLNKFSQLVQEADRKTLRDLRDLEEAILSDTRRLIPDIKIDGLIVMFDNRLPANLNATTLNVELIKECVEALLINALLFTSVGSVVVSMSCTPDHSALVFDVEDTGRGIHRNNHARIFEDYEKEDSHTGGAGLGLTLAAKIAAAMSGTVELVASIPRQGSHFRLTLQDPQLSCHPNAEHPSGTNTFAGLASTFTTIPDKPPSIPMLRFAAALKRRGMQRASGRSGGLTVVSYDPRPATFKDYLEEANSVAGMAVCFVPATLHTTPLRRSYPHIYFFKGPFTTKRINDILSRLSDPSLDRKSITSPILAKSLENKIREDAGSVQRAARPQVLLVDDNEINLRIFRMWCAKRSHPNKSAMDGLQAIAQYKQSLLDDKAVSLILLDLQMPNCDGIEACTQIRQIEKEQRLQPSVIFIVTGQDDPKDRERSLQAGADEFYVKPMGIKMLDQATARYFEF